MHNPRPDGHRAEAAAALQPEANPTVRRRPPHWTFALRPPDGKRTPRAKVDGYLPNHQVRPSERHGGEPFYPASGRTEPGTAAAVEVSFLFPAQIGACLWPGKRLRVQEGETVVGIITVTAGRAAFLPWTTPCFP